MQVRASIKNSGVSAKKVRPLLNALRGRPVQEALAALRLVPQPSARLVAKVIRSAAANAENNFQMEPASLRIVGIYADEASMLRRFQPRARGRAGSILKRSSHITVIVDEGT